MFLLPLLLFTMSSCEQKARQECRQSLFANKLDGIVIRKMVDARHNGWIHFTTRGISVNTFVEVSCFNLMQVNDSIHKHKNDSILFFFRGEEIVCQKNIFLDNVYIDTNDGSTRVFCNRVFDREL